MSSASSRPPITLNSLDVARLERLLDQPHLHDDAMALALGEEIARASVLPPQQMPGDVVTMNSTVTCVEEIGGRQHILTLVYPGETGEGKVSVLAPVGAALLGLSVGQSIDWAGPDGRALRVKVAGIVYQPEAAGDWQR